MKYSNEQTRFIIRRINAFYKKANFTKITNPNLFKRIQARTFKKEVSNASPELYLAMLQERYLQLYDIGQQAKNFKLTGANAYEIFKQIGNNGIGEVISGISVKSIEFEGIKWAIRKGILYKVENGILSRTYINYRGL